MSKVHREASGELHLVLNILDDIGVVTGSFLDKTKLDIRPEYLGEYQLSFP
jgi:hypothetical protein